MLDDVCNHPLCIHQIVDYNEYMFYIDFHQLQHLKHHVHHREENVIHIIQLNNHQQYHVVVLVLVYVLLEQ
jgi:hypothetical protein